MLKKAFSLIELSIAIVVISILIVGFLNVSSGKNSNNKVKITKDRIDIVYKSLGEFVLKNKRLPCPASIKAIKTRDANYGIEGTAAGICTSGTGVYLSTASGATNMVYGMIPVKSLGLSNDYGEDGFGSKFAYIIDKTYTTDATFSTSSGSILIQKYINGAYVSDSNNAIFAIISYGPNKSSSFNVNSSSQNTITADADEMFNDPITLNDNDGAKTADFSQTLVNSSERSTTFDDIVFYKSRDQFLKDSKAANIVNGNITSSANITAQNCTGGVISSVSGSTVHTFKTSATLDCLNKGTRTAQLLVVAGGGSGGAHSNTDGIGGGGGGGVFYASEVSLDAAQYYVTVGAGATGSSGLAGNNGGNSSFKQYNTSTALVTVVGGGGGGGNGSEARPGGSGGGGWQSGGAGGASKTGSKDVSVSGDFYGNNGGSSTGSAGGGGGGASAAGGSASTSNGGDGGSGFTSYISGPYSGSGPLPVYGSGGGGNGTGTKGLGGTNAGDAGTANKNAVSNFGGGGGAVKGNNPGGSGGSGVVIIRY